MDGCGRRWIQLVRKKKLPCIYCKDVFLLCVHCTLVQFTVPIFQDGLDCGCGSHERERECLYVWRRRFSYVANNLDRKSGTHKTLCRPIAAACKYIQIRRVLLTSPARIIACRRIKWQERPAAAACVLPERAHWIPIPYCWLTLPPYRVRIQQ